MAGLTDQSLEVLDRNDIRAIHGLDPGCRRHLRVAADLTRDNPEEPVRSDASERDDLIGRVGGQGCVEVWKTSDGGAIVLMQYSQLISSTTPIHPLSPAVIFAS